MIKRILLITTFIIFSKNQYALAALIECESPVNLESQKLANDVNKVSCRVPLTISNSELILNDNNIDPSHIEALFKRFCNSDKSSNCKGMKTSLKKLRLNFANLSGKNLKEFRNALKQLPITVEVLNLSGTKIGDQEFESLPDLPHLKTLIADYTNFRSKIIEIIVNKFKNLQNLSLNSIDDPIPIKNIKPLNEILVRGLKSLNIRGIKIDSEKLKSINPVNQITSLSLYTEGLDLDFQKDISHIFPQLSKLELTGDEEDIPKINLKLFSDLASLRRLKSLIINSSNFELELPTAKSISKKPRVVQELSKMKDLEELKITKSPIINWSFPEMFEQIGELTKLKSLSLDHVKAGPKQSQLNEEIVNLKKCKQLVYLRLIDFQISPSKEFKETLESLPLQEANFQHSIFSKSTHIDNLESRKDVLISLFQHPSLQRLSWEIKNSKDELNDFIKILSEKGKTSNISRINLIGELSAGQNSIYEALQEVNKYRAHTPLEIYVGFEPVSRVEEL